MAYQPEMEKPLGNQDRLFLIGTFFEELAAYMLSGTLNPDSWNSTGDVILESLDAFVEVKGRSNRNAVRVFLSQLDRLRANTPFPYGNCWYLLASYQNHATLAKKARGRKRVDRQQPLLTNRSYTNDKLQLFLREQTDLLCLMHSDVLDRMRHHEEHVKSSDRRAGKPADTVRIGRRYIHLLATNGELGKLGFSPHELAVRDMKVTLGHPYEGMRFRLVLILPRKQLRSVLDTLREHCTLS